MNPMNPLTQKHTDCAKDFLKDAWSRIKDHRDMEQIIKGHRQHEHDEEMDIQYHRRAEETKKF